ncbi:MAG: proprotein convertase P-domain-containing protein [Phycisphaerae bacterium]|nr:proprotein convertase P-domain-containing protein [Phycisphaerae bacterium]
MFPKARVTAGSSFIVSLIALGILAVQQPLAAQDCGDLPPIDGRNLQTKYDDAVSVVQDNPTGWGDQAPPSTEDTQGNELDQVFLANDNYTLHIGITGNTQRTDTLDNTVLVFIDTDPGATPSVLSTAGFTDPNASAALVNMDGVTLDFDPEYVIAVWNDLGLGDPPTYGQHGVLHDLTDGTTVTVLVENTDFAVDNSNLLGVSADPSHDPLQQEINAASATTGFEFAIPLDDLDFTVPLTEAADINIQALIANFAGYISNQSLAVLNPTSGSEGGGQDCLGVHDPVGDPPEVPPNIIDFSADGNPQYVPYTLLPAGTPPGGTLDGADIPTDFGTPPEATQNNYTCFGDAAPFSPYPTNGSEIDQVFIANDFSKLYIGVTGNIPFNDYYTNTILVFIQTGSGTGSNVMYTTGITGGANDGAVLVGMDGVTLDTDFAPQWVLEYWRGQTGLHNGTLEDLIYNENVKLEPSWDTARHTDNNGVSAIAANLYNTAGVNSFAGDDPIRQEGKAAEAQSGVIFTVPLSVLGIGETDSIKVAVAVVGGTGFISNQWLPPFNPTNYTPVIDSVTFNDAPLPLAIPDDGGSTSAEDLRTVTMPTIDRITDISVSISITHPDVSQLSVTLQYELGEDTREAELLSAGSGSGVDLNTTWDSDTDAVLLNFAGADPNGDWTMVVTDSVTGQSGTLNSWGMEITEYTGGNVDCLGFHDATENPIDLSDNDAFPEYQRLAITLSPGSPPNDFSAEDIPSAFPSAALATQNNWTCFGDAQPPDLEQPTPGSEMDELFVTNTADRLHLAISGNLETNGNAFVLLFDTVSGDGENTLADNPTPPRPIGGNPDNPGGEPGLNGTILDADFYPDYGLSVHEFYGDYRVDLVDLNADTNKWLGVQGFGSGSGELQEPAANTGSELNEMFVQNDDDNVYIGLTSNIEGNSNAFVIFIETAGAGSNPLYTVDGTNFPPQLVGMDSDTLSPGFYPDYALVVWRVDWEFQTARLCDLVGQGEPTDIPWSSTMLPDTFVGDNSNLVGVNDNPADDPGQQAINAASATTGLLFAIDRASIGSPDTNIKISVVLVGSAGYWSNQFLPGAGGGVANLSAGDPPVDPVDASGVHTVVTYTLSETPSWPGTWDGTEIPTAMSGGLQATQNNYTGFGDQIVDPAYNNDNCAQVAFDNTNILGVTGCSQQGTPCTCLGGSVEGADSVDTGMEVDLAVEDLGLTPEDIENGVTIKVMAVLTSNTGYVSNQTLPGLGGGVCQLAWTPDFTGAAGVQFLEYQLEKAALLGDMNCDGFVDVSDIEHFVQALVDPAGYEADHDGDPYPVCDILNGDFADPSGVDGLDVQGFVDALIG